MKHTKLWLIAFLACVMAVTGIFALTPQQALAEENVLGNVIDMRATDLVEVPMLRTGEQTFQESALSGYVWSHNGEIPWTGNKIFLDAATTITFKVVFPYNVAFAAVQIMLDAGGTLALSADGTTWDAANTIVKPGPEWAEHDITQYLGHDEENQQDVVFFRVQDTTPADGSGPIIRILNFVCAQSYDFSDASTELPSLTAERTDGFVVLPGDPGSDEASYLITQNGQESSGGFRFFDGAGASYGAVRDANPTGYSWSNLAVYKFTYGADALALKLRLEISGQYRVDVATALDESLGAQYYDADALTANGAPWTRVAVGTYGVVAQNYVTVDISQFMKDNTARTIYVKISDPTSWYGNGACLFSMQLIETCTAAAPAVAPSDALSEVFVGQEVDLGALFTVETVDENATYAYTVNGSPVDGSAYIPTEAGSLEVGLTVTDANGGTGSAAATLTVRSVVATGITLTSGPMVTEYGIGDALDLTGAVVTVTYSDGSSRLVDVTAEMVSGYDAATAGEQTLTVTCEGFTATFTVTVTAEATGIILKSGPTVTEYGIGDALDLTGAVVTVTYSDGSTRDVDVTADMVSGYDAGTAGEQTLTVTCEGFTATFTVTVTRASRGCTGMADGAAECAVLLLLAGALLLFKRIRAR